MGNQGLDVLHLSFEWPLRPDESFQEEFIVGVWHPSADVRLNVRPGHSLDESLITGSNWAIMSSCSPFKADGHGLTHLPHVEPGANTEIDLEAVAFRGYILEPPLHSWSNADDIINYWQHHHVRHNGVFASILIGAGGGELRLTTDAFGVASLYYREFAGAVLFSTNSRFLSTAIDRLDRVSARFLMQTGSVYGHGSLTEGVRRVPPGTTLSFRDGAVTETKWFAYPELPTGGSPISDAALKDVEDAFQNAMSRCLALQTPGALLPLSSGHDSRLILASLHSQQVLFSALTVRVLQKEWRDLDGHWSSVMSRELGFQHQVVEIPQPAEYVRLDRMRRLLLDAHGCEHTWFLSLYPYLPRQSCAVFDGLGGDVFGNTGYGVEEHYLADEPRTLELILNEIITSHLDGILKGAKWPSTASLRGALTEFLRDLPAGRLKSDLSFLWTRTRCGPGMCAQRLIPAGHVTVYPYYDLDYVWATLDINPLDKLPPNTLQARCLKQFWPRYDAFGGSRNIPPDSQPGDPASNERLHLACSRQLLAEVAHPLRALAGEVTARAFAGAAVSLVRESVLKRTQWWLQPLLTLLARQAGSRACWTRVES